MYSRISIALSVYNGEDYLLDQLLSIDRQTRRPDQIVFVDDFSSDNSINILRDYEEKSEIEVIVLENHENLGYARSFSRALENCDGDVVFMCDQDDVWFPNKIERIMSFFESDFSAQLLIHDIEYCKEDLTPIGQTKIERMQESFDLERDYVVGMATAVRGSFLKLCLPVPDVSCVSHDVWLHECAWAIGRKRIIPDVLAYYRRHANNATCSGSLNVDFVTTNEHFVGNEEKSIIGLMTKKTFIRHRELSPLCNVLCRWFQVTKPLLVERGYVDEVYVEGVLKRIVHRVESNNTRHDILKMHKSKRLPAIISFYLDGGYSYYSGLKSAIKDLLIN